jgi:hypothetical protein
MDCPPDALSETGPEYWVYQNSPRKRARLHRSDCVYCQRGRERMSLDADGVVKWHGPFQTRTGGLRMLWSLPSDNDLDVCRCDRLDEPWRRR